ncbi:MAG: CZB domain-containing protein [Verrucomicrobia bacterium]|nr:CZB domain-containing protein [Verrucomicrobiota bacterium]
MELEIELRQAIASHGAWKERLRLAVETGRSDISVETVCRDDRCALGRMLEACDAGTKQSVRWKCVREVHADFHRSAGQILEHALAGRPREARAAMAYTSAYAGLSAKLIAELSAWKSEAARMPVAVR